MEIVRLDTLLLQERCDLLSVPPRRAIDDHTAWLISRQIGLYDLMDMVELFPTACLNHDEVQVGALSAPVEHLQLDIEFLPEIVQYLHHHVGLSGCS